MPYRNFALLRPPAALLAVLSLSALLGAHADPATPTNASKHEMALRAATPQSVIETFHWTKPENLPEGVTSIAAAPAGKALVVTGTDEGFHSVQEMVAMVDIQER